MGEIELGPAAEATIQAYKELAVDPGKRLALALDRTCIQFLAYVVAEGEGSLVQAAIDTLVLIAQAKECRPSLANTFGVLEALQSVTEDEASYSQNLRNQAAGLFTSLQFARHIKKSQGETKKQEDDSRSSLSSEPSSTSTVSTYTPTTSTSEQTSVKQPDDVDGRATDEAKSKTESVVARTEAVKKDAGPTKMAVEKRESFLGPHNSKAKMVTLFIKGMVNPEHRQLVEEQLVRVRGLISIVFDLGHSRVTCRVKRDLVVEKLAAAVARTETLTALLVTTSATGEEEMVSLDPATRTVPAARSEEEDLPDYLPEEDLVPVEDATSAMAPSGTFMETATSWFSSATNLLNKSFYW